MLDIITFIVYNDSHLPHHRKYHTLSWTTTNYCWLVSKWSKWANSIRALDPICLCRYLMSAWWHFILFPLAYIYLNGHHCWASKWIFNYLQLGLYFIYIVLLLIVIKNAIVRYRISINLKYFTSAHHFLGFKKFGLWDRRFIINFLYISN